MTLQITVVIPTFNEAENLPELVSASLSLPLPGLKLLVVDDASPDGTGQVADRLAVEYAGRVQVIHRPERLGYGPAVRHGFQTALDSGVDVVGQMDADFSHPPLRLVELAAALSECDIALGSRYTTGGSLDENWPLWRRNLSTFGNTYARSILGLPLQDATGGFRLFRRQVLQKLPLKDIRSNGYTFQIEVAYLAYLYGCTFCEIPIHFGERMGGKSKMCLKIQIEAALRVWQMRWRYRGLRRLLVKPAT